ncbi:MAG TPA: ATP-binding cassette domain-containing protein [Steroidobacteraceae bacterium]|nr:ATP-binding cassette domain-containing protein [Steroidobacteraceae bacterium]
MQHYLQTRLRHVELRRSGRMILKGIDWIISPGEHWVLAGANGAGKTQLLKLVAGSVWPTPTGRESRRYRWQGRTHETPFEVSEEIAYVGPERQDRYERYDWNHTVEEIVGTGLHRTDIPLRTLSVRERRTIARHLEALALTTLTARRFLTLSYGERRLVLLARALAGRPKLLLLDELLSGLDGANRLAALDWLNRTRGKQLPWVLATHRLEDLPASATHALVLRRGHIVYRGALPRASLAKWLTASRGRAARAHAPRDRGAASRTRAPLVCLRNASVFLDERAVLEGISLQVAPGQCWILHGPNGAGKSTLLRTLYGDHGVAIGGQLQRARIRSGVPLAAFQRRVGLVAPHLQSLASASFGRQQGAPSPSMPPRAARGELPDLTVQELVESGRYASVGLIDAPNALDRRAARAALAEFGLTRLANRAVRELSYGQARRVLFARAWVNRPALLLLDEPLAGVDAPTRGVLLAALDKVARRGAAIVMATHLRGEWPRCVTHELELGRGRVRYCGPVREHHG